ncbi:MAG: sigma-70 family RNA polymerase sigma factor [Actinomycetota bacterium]
MAHEPVEHLRALLAAAAKGDRVACDRVVRAELPLVRRIAARYRHAGLPFDDLVQEGAVGVVEAIRDYDPAHGVAFEVYARFRIHRAIRNALTERSRLVRLPKHVVERRRLLERERASIFASSGHEPTPAELAQRTGLPLPVILAALDAAIDAASLDEPVTAGGSTLEELVADPAAVDPEVTVIDRDVIREVDEAVERLPERQRTMIEHTFGFGMPAETLAEVAGEFHLSPQRTRTIVVDALERLRRELEILLSTL